MSTPPTAKRRRLSNSALHKPFRSPLHAPASSRQQPTATPTRPRQTPYTPYRSSTLKSSSRTATHSAATPAADPEAAAAQKRIRELELRARDLRSQIGVLSQAASTSESASAPAPAGTPQPRSSRLASLTAKWRTASQVAADALFPDFSARVRDSGGLSSFRAPRSHDDGDEAGDSGDEEGWRDELGEVLTAGEKARRRKSRDGRRAAEDEVDRLDRDQDLTMGKMLAVLGIPRETIGWDERAQAWLP